MSLANHSWRSFQFFDRVAATKPGSDGEKVHVFEGLAITKWACTEGGGPTYFSEPNGIVLQLNSDYEVQIWKAYQHRLVDIGTGGGALIVTVGEDESASTHHHHQQHPVLKLWDATEWGENSPACRLTNRINVGRRAPSTSPPSPISCVAMSQRGTALAVGFEDTSVFFTQSADFAKERGGALKYRPLREGASVLGGGKLVGLVARSFAARDDVEAVLVLSTHSLHSYLISKTTGQVIQTLKHNVGGCASPDCWSLSAERNQLVVAGKEMVHLYALNTCLFESGAENGRCCALSRGGDQHRQLICAGSHVLTLARDQSDPGGGEGPTSSSSPPSSETTAVTVYDVERSYVAFTTTVPFACKAFTLDGEVHLLNSDGVLTRLVEKPLNKKLEVLLRKGLYDLAIELSKGGRSNSNSEQLHKLNIQYGDHLYGRGDFENSIRQYMEAAGHVEPSYVIKKFLDGSRVAQLCSYLELLHDRGLAVTEHTTLLLTAYVKLAAKEKLDEFVDKSTRFQRPIDVDRAVELLRSSRYGKVAARLALAHGRPESFVSVLVEDNKDCAAAVRFIGKLPPEQTLGHLDRHGSALLERCPTETLELVKVVANSESALSRLSHVLATHPAAASEVYAHYIQQSGEINDVKLRNVVLEQLLSSPTSAGIRTDKAWEERILRLARPDNYGHALQLARVNNFPPLVVHILRATKRTEDLLRYMLREGNVDDVIECCGEEALKNMWIELIAHVSDKEHLDPGSLMTLLERVTETNCVHPLVVLEILSRNDTLQVGHIKDYVVGWLARQSTLIEGNEKSIDENERQIERMERELDELSNSVQIFQTNKCAACNSVLSLPAVHFLCKHAFHTRCFEEFSGQRPDQCPSCRSAAGGGVGKREDEKETTSHPSTTKPPPTYQQFQTDLSESTDAIELISKYIASGAFDSNR